MEIDRDGEYRDGDGDDGKRGEGPERPTLTELWSRGEVIVLDDDGEY